VAVRLRERVHLVGSGWLGFGLTDRHDSHVYLLDGGTASVLVDAGCGLATGEIVDRVRATGAAPVTRILLTHGHADHAAGAGALARALGGAQVCASPEVARMLGDADEAATGLDVARAAGTYPSHLSLAPTEVDAVTGPIEVGDLRVTPIPTPGHAAGHLCYLATGPGLRAVFTGDLVFARGRVAVLGTRDTDLGALRDSVDAVAATRPDALFPGHGSVALTGAAAHLDIAVAAFDRGALPPGLLP